VTLMDDHAAPASRHRVVLVDDHADVRELLRLRIDATEDLTVVGTAGTAATGVEVARDLQPDVVLLDVGLPDLAGLQVIPRIREAAPRTRIVVLSGYAASERGDAALRAGADGYVEKRPRAPFVEAIRAALAHREGQDS